MQPMALSAFEDNYIWIIQESNTFICVDPGDAIPVLDYAKKTGFTLSHILLTHHHGDHIQGVGQLKNVFHNVRIYGPKDNRLDNIHPIFQVNISTYAYQFNCLDTPGHTATHICYHEPNQGWLFCGDTLFSGGCGRVFDGTMKELYTSLMQLKDLPAHTKVFCGHEYTRKNLKFALSIEPNNKNMNEHLLVLNQDLKQCSLPSTIGLEKEINPFFRVHSFQEFQALREQKDNWVS